MPRKKTDDRLLYDTGEVARMLSISKPTVVRLIWSSELFGIRVGTGRRYWAVTRESIDAYLAARKAERLAEMAELAAVNHGA